MGQKFFTLKGSVENEECARYDFADNERDKYIAEITEKVRKDVRLNEIKEAESIRYASKFVATK